MPHFRPWPSHSCRRSPLFSEQDAPVPCPLPPSHSHAIAGPSSRLAAPEKSQTGPAPRTSLLPACWDTGRVSVHAGVLQGPSAKARVHSRGSCTRLQTRLAPQMCPRSPQLGPVPRAAAQPGEAVRSPGAGASGLSGSASRSPHLFAEPPKVGPGRHHGHSLRCLSLEAAASRTPPRVPGRGSVAVEGPHPDRVPHGSGRLEFSFGLAHETGAAPLGSLSPAQGPSSEKLQPRTRPATPHRCGARWPPCP